MRSPRVLAALLLSLAGSITSLGFGSMSASATPTDIGYRDPSFAASGVSAPTGQKPQSKLWFNDGAWWGALFSTSLDGYSIWQLDKVTQTWSDTTVLVEPRNNARLDLLFDGTSLYVVSGEVSAAASTPMELRRYSYSPSTRTYQLAPGFPATIVTGGTESAVIDKDTTGTLWVTYTRSNSVYVTHSTVDDATWVTPFVLPTVGATNLLSEDQSAVVAHGGKIGVMWSNQNDHAMYFADHVDGTLGSEWTLNPAVQQTEWADDHLNLKAANDGRVFAVTKTSLNGPADPLIILSVLELNGTWSRYTFATVAEQHTRPIVQLDEDNDRVYVFASAPCCSGGVIYYKSAPLSAISFAPGLGTPIIVSSLDPKVNNVSSTKQAVGNQSGLVIIAGDDSTRRYLHNQIVLGADTTAPNTVISSAPPGSSGPDDAVFAFFSSKAGSTFECRLDGGAFAACSSPKSYSGLAVGVHDFAVRATDSTGNTDQSPATHTWNVSAISVVTLSATADTFINQAAPATNYGTSTVIDVDGNAGAARRGLIRFDLSSLQGQVIEARLRTYVTNGTTNGPLVHIIQPGWTENQVTWSTQPALIGQPILDLGTIAPGAWLEIDVTSGITGNGTLDLGFVPQSSDGLVFYSRQGSSPPTLQVTTQAIAGPDTIIQSGPEPYTASGSASFTFSATDPAATFRCQLDGGGFAICASPVSLSSLADGVHTFEVVATDLAGNTDPSPAVAQWTVDTVAPTVLSTDPVDGAAGVPASALIRVVFSEAMDAASISGASLRLLDNQAAPVAGAVGYEVSSRTATFTPSAPLRSLASYVVELSGAADMAGNLAPASTWGFTTTSVIVVTPTGDSYVDERRPNANYGALSALTADGGSGIAKEALLKFDVTGVTGSVISAKLRVFVTNGTTRGPQVFGTATSWIESSATWTTRPGRTTGALVATSSIATGVWHEFDITVAVAGNGSYSFVLAPTSTDALRFDSREGTNAPQLIILQS